MFQSRWTTLVSLSYVPSLCNDYLSLPHIKCIIFCWFDVILVWFDSGTSTKSDLNFATVLVTGFVEHDVWRVSWRYGFHISNLFQSVCSVPKNLPSPRFITSFKLLRFTMSVWYPSASCRSWWTTSRLNPVNGFAPTFLSGHRFALAQLDGRVTPWC
jgi:hypothetical protein